MDNMEFWSKWDGTSLRLFDVLFDHNLLNDLESIANLIEKININTDVIGSDLWYKGTRINAYYSDKDDLMVKLGFNNKVINQFSSEIDKLYY